MRFLKQLQLNKRDVKDQRVSALGNGEILLNTTNTLQLPKGTTGQVVGTPAEGMIRYNTDAGNVQVYQGSSWRNLRYQESGTIIQQNLGAGDSNTVYFGPLNAAYNSNVASNNSTYGGQNILVIVENIIQLSTINYTVVNSTGTISAETYLPTLSVAATTSSTVLYFNSAVFVTGGSAVGSAVTLTIANTTGQVPFAVAAGSYILVTGCSDATNGTNSPYNGTYLVTGSTATTVSYTASSAPGTFQYGGQATACTSTGAVKAVFPANPSLLTGVTITASGLYSPTTISSYTLDSNTDALTSITISHVPTAGVDINSTITITENSSSVSGYYLKFTDPVPLGKTVIALIGFDQ